MTPFKTSKNSFPSSRLFFALCVLVLSIGFIFVKTSIVFADPATVAQLSALTTLSQGCAVPGNISTPTPIPPVVGVLTILGGTITSDPTKCGADVARQAILDQQKSVLAPTWQLIAVQSLLKFSTYVANRVAYEAAVYIANGGPGQGSVFYKKTSSDAWATLGNDIAGSAVDDLQGFLTQGLGTSFNICAPQSPLIQLALKLSVKQAYQPTPPACNFEQMKNNWGKVWADASAILNNQNDALNNFLLQTAQQSLAPGSNELGASISLNFLIANQVQQAKVTKTAQQNASQGFNNVTDIITGNVKTPSAVLQKDFQDKLAAQHGDATQITAGQLLASGGAWTQLGVMATSTFANTLASQLLNKVYTGLFDTKADPGTTFNVEGVSNDVTSSKAQLSSIFAPSTISISDNNVLQEFSSCPQDGTLNRGADQCVIDTDLFGALSQASSNTGAAQTVQQALDSGALHGNYPLISPINTDFKRGIFGIE